MLQTLSNPVLAGQMPLSSQMSSQSGSIESLSSEEGVTSGVFVDILKDLNVLDESLSLVDGEPVLAADGSALPLDGNALPSDLIEDVGLSLETDTEVIPLDLGAVSDQRMLGDAALAQWAGTQRNLAALKEAGAPVPSTSRVGVESALQAAPLLSDSSLSQTSSDVLGRHAQLLMTEKGAAEGGVTAFTKNLTDMLKTNNGSTPLALGAALPAVPGSQDKPLLTPAPGVSHATIHTPVGQPGWDNELGNRVSWMMRQNVPVAEVKLTPANLGPIEIKVSVTNDQATVTMTAAHAMTKDALEVAMPRLREMLADSGITLTNANVSSQAQHGGQGGQSQSDNLSSHAEGMAGDADVNDGDGSIATSRIKVDKGLVDIFA